MRQQDPAKAFAANASLPGEQAKPVERPSQLMHSLMDIVQNAECLTNEERQTILRAVDAIGTAAPDCEHEWVSSMRPDVVKGTWCNKCGLIQEEAQATPAPATRVEPGSAERYAEQERKAASFSEPVGIVRSHRPGGRYAEWYRIFDYAPVGTLIYLGATSEEAQANPAEPDLYQVKWRSEGASWINCPGAAEYERAMGFGGYDGRKLYAALPQCVLDLIAVLNRDGGHYRAEFGLEAACKRGMERYYEVVTEADRLGFERAQAKAPEGDAWGRALRMAPTADWLPMSEHERELEGAQAKPAPDRDFGDFATEHVLAWIDSELEEADAHDPTSGIFEDRAVGDALRWLRANLFGLKQGAQAKPAEPLTVEFIEQHIGPDEGDRDAVLAIVREVEHAHGIMPAFTRANQAAADRATLASPQPAEVPALTDERIDALAKPFESEIEREWQFDIRGFARAVAAGGWKQATPAKPAAWIETDMLEILQRNGPDSICSAYATETGGLDKPGPRTPVYVGAPNLANDSWATNWLTNGAELHPLTANLVVRFARALAKKLAAAEKKYGFTDGWRETGWMDDCRARLKAHMAKGDPRDVAAYCAFLWHHGESTVK